MVCVLLMQLKDTSRKFIFNTKLSTQQFRAIIKVKINFLEASFNCINTIKPRSPIFLRIEGLSFVFANGLCFCFCKWFVFCFCKWFVFCFRLRTASVRRFLCTEKGAPTASFSRSPHCPPLPCPPPPPPATCSSLAPTATGCPSSSNHQTFKG